MGTTSNLAQRISIDGNLASSSCFFLLLLLATMKRGKSFLDKPLKQYYFVGFSRAVCWMVHSCKKNDNEELFCSSSRGTISCLLLEVRNLSVRENFAGLGATTFTCVHSRRPIDRPEPKFPVSPIYLYLLQVPKRVLPFNPACIIS